VLVRPDGYVAWRSRSGTPEPAEVLRAVFDGLCGRTRQPALSVK
jgi:putative polyketide hydroxylase